MIIIISYRVDLLTNCLEQNMGEVVRFIPKSELERMRLIREARAIYDSIFPPSVPAGENDKASATYGISGTNAHRGDGGRVS
jgi:hypothetical protein